MCINQVWIPERNVQVPRMRSICNEARLVWIWLGDGIEEIGIAFSFLSEVAAILENTTPPGSPQLTESYERFKS
jgi:hypothetical protein